jgi:hypothetical protein
LSYLPKCRDSVWACKKLYLEYKTVDFQLKCEDTKGVVQAVNREKDRQYNNQKKKNNERINSGPQNTIQKKKD